MDLKSLESLSIEQCDAAAAIIATRRKKLVDEMVAECEERERKLREQNIALLAKYAVEYKPAVAASRVRKGPKQPSPYKKGHVYRHPDDAKLTFKGGGMVPKWARELPAGKVAMEVAQQ